MLAKGLREQDYAVDVATDGDEAPYRASINDYALVILDIILDIMLPRKDGLQFAGKCALQALVRY